MQVLTDLACEFVDYLRMSRNLSSVSTLLVYAVPATFPKQVSTLTGYMRYKLSPSHRLYLLPANTSASIG